MNMESQNKIGIPLFKMHDYTRLCRALSSVEPADLKYRDMMSYISECISEHRSVPIEKLRLYKNHRNVMFGNIVAVNNSPEYKNYKSNAYKPNQEILNVDPKYLQEKKAGMISDLAVINASLESLKSISKFPDESVTEAVSIVNSVFHLHSIVMEDIISLIDILLS